MRSQADTRKLSCTPPRPNALCLYLAVPVRCHCPSAVNWEVATFGLDEKTFVLGGTYLG